MPFTLRSTAFHDGGMIPREFTCDGGDRTPALTWAEAPDGTRSFVLIMDDPDAPGGTFTHWLAYDIPASATEIADRPPGKTLPNDFGRAGYGGPCPPRGHGPHRYFFTLHAVDVPTLTVQGNTRAALERALDGHSLGAARLMGRFERKGKR